MGVAHDIDTWVRPPIGRGPDGASRLEAARAAGPSADFSFWDLLDVINPLQHIPIVSSIYRRLTGDEISPHARILGATLYGGPIGLIASTQIALLEQASGHSIEHVVTAGLLADPPRGAGAGPVIAARPDPAEAPVAPIQATRTGQEALRAYASDLRSLGRPGGNEIRAVPAQAQPPGPEPAIASAFSAKMMEGLRKYESISRAGIDSDIGSDAAIRDAI